MLTIERYLRSAGNQSKAASWALQRSYTSGDKAYKDIQNPDKTKPAYSQEPDSSHRKLPEEKDNIEGIEERIKFGQNTPTSLSDFAHEMKDAAFGLAESVEQGVKAMGNKAVDAAAAVKRSVGLETSPKALSNDHIHGAAGKMEHAPLYTNKKVQNQHWTQHDRTDAEAKYQEISDTEKPHFPHQEQSINELFPDMREAAKLQNKGGPKDTEGLEGNLHNKGP